MCAGVGWHPADHPDWRLVIAGAKRFEAAARGSYEAQISDVMKGLGEQAVMTGFIPISEVREWQAKAVFPPTVAVE